MLSFVNDLVKIGLTENEAKTYLLLLKHKLTAAKIAQSIGVNRSNIYGIISSLIEKGFIREMNANVRTFVANNPKIAFNASKNALQTRIKLMDKLAEELYPHFEAEKDNKNELIKILHSRAAILNTLEKLESEAEKEVLAFSKPPYIMKVDDLSDLNKVQKESANKGVLYKAVHEIETDNLDNFVKRMQYFASLGEEVRVAHQLPMKLFIFDQKIAVFTLENKLSNISHFTFTSFEHTDVAKTFTQIFNQYWENAIPLDKFLKQIKRS